MKNFKSINKITAGVALSLALSACGGQSYRAETASSSALTSSSVNSTSSSTETSSTANTLTAEDYSWVIYGKGAWTTHVANSPDIQTDDSLKVDISVNSAPITLAYSDNRTNNYTFPYACARAYVSLIDATSNAIIATRQTKIFDVDGNCSLVHADAVSSDTIDFSDKLVPGHGKMIIRVSGLTDTAQCQRQAGSASYGSRNTISYCPNLVDNYTATDSAGITTYYKITGAITVHTNGTN